MTLPLQQGRSHALPATLAGLALLSAGCGQPDPIALKRLGCEQER